MILVMGKIFIVKIKCIKCIKTYPSRGSITFNKTPVSISGGHSARIRQS